MDVRSRARSPMAFGWRPRQPQALPEKLAKGTINCLGCPPYTSKPWCR
jgi:hypothetical protein